MVAEGNVIRTAAELEARYGEPPPTALFKEVDRLTDAYKRFAEAAPFVALATVGTAGLDCSPRGDAGTVVTVADETTLHLPDRRGNNRLDSLRNIVEDPRLALLFLVPGVAECLRINGSAQLSTDPELLARYTVGDRQPATVVVVTVGSVYFQCARAIKRADLWNPARHTDPAELPSAGRMAADAGALAGGAPEFDPITYDAELADRQARTLY